MELKCEKDWKELLSKVDAFIFDCDGVLWIGDTEVDGASLAIAKLKQLNKKVYFVTNNSTKSREQYLAKFIKMGFPVELEEIMCTTFATAYYMKNILNFDGKAYVLGLEGFKQELEDHGIQTCGVGPELDSSDKYDHNTLKNIPLRTDISAVIVGFDFFFSYTKMIKAASYLLNPNCLFIATNEDDVLPSNCNTVLPGTGAFVSAIKTASRRTPIVIGKPNKPMFECCSLLGKIDPKRTLMIGDRLTTDIPFGRRNEMMTVLTLSGGTSRDDLNAVLSRAVPGEDTPDYYTTSIGTFHF